MKPILDACCGSRMFWFDRQNKDVIYLDNREEDAILSDGRRLVVAPDIVGDFRALPFPNGRFKLVVFDPPHLVRVGKRSWMFRKYGKLGAGWRADLKQGFRECFRVLDDNGILIFKWSEQQIRLSEIKSLFPCEPLLGDRRSKTLWLVFMKVGGDTIDR